MALSQSALAELLEVLEDEARTELIRQDIPAGTIRVRRQLHLKYQGTDTALTVAADRDGDGDAGDEAALMRAFEAEHRKRYGFVIAGKALVVEAVSVEAPAVNP